jgi:hypothetical protein
MQRKIAIQVAAAFAYADSSPYPDSADARLKVYR